MSSKVNVERFLVKDFAAYVQRTDTYKDCHVIAMTHCKNANCDYLHEYLHLLICDKDYRKWTRVIAERKRRDDPDQVVIGVWPWIRSSFDLRRGGESRDDGSTIIPNNGSAGGEPYEYEKALPLLLRNVIFNPPLDLRSVAKVLVRVHNKEPVYHLLSVNCYWYAHGVFEALKMLRGRSKLTNFYPWLNSEGKKRYVLYARVNKAMVKRMREAAEKFDESLENNPWRGPAQDGEDVPQVPEDDPVGAIAKTAVEDEINTDNSVTDIMKELDYAKNLDESATREQATSLKHDLQEFTAAVLADSEKEMNLAAYNARVSQEPPEVVDDDDAVEFIKELEDAVKHLKVDVMTEKEEADYEEALRVFVGGVLREMESEGAGI